MTADSEKDIQYLKAIGRVVAMALKKMMKEAQPGITTAELDAIGSEFLKKEGAISAHRRCINSPVPPASAFRRSSPTAFPAIMS